MPSPDIETRPTSEEEIHSDSDTGWSTLSDASTDTEDPASSGDDDSDDPDLPTVEDLMQRARVLEQSSDKQTKLDDQLWFLARDIWDWYQRQDIDVQESSCEVALEAAVRLCRRSLQLRPVGHPKRAHSLHNLAKYLLELHEEHDVGVPDLSMLAECVMLSREALCLRPLENRHHQNCLETLFEALVATYCNGDGDQSIFEETVAYGEQVLQFYPLGVDASLRGYYLGLFGELWWGRAQFTERAQDRENGIRYYREALECPYHNTDELYLHMSTLALWLEVSANHGQESTSISFKTDGAMRTRNSREIPSILDVKLATTARAQLDTSKVEEAIMWLTRASELVGLSKADRSKALESLGSALVTWASLTESPDHLHQAIMKFCKAMEILPPTEHGPRSHLLGSLADANSHLYGMTDEASYLLEAVKYSQQALDLCDRQPISERAEMLVDLALLQYDQAIEFSDGTCMKLAIGHLQDALSIQSTLGDERETVKIYGELASCFLCEHLPSFDILQGSQYLSLAIKQKVLPARATLIRNMHNTRLLGRAVVSTKEGQLYRDRLGEMLHEVMNLFAGLVSVGQDLDMRLASLKGFERFGEAIAMDAMSLDMNEFALEILEQARGLFWTQALYLRKAALDLVPNELAIELRALLTSLDEKTLEDASADGDAEDPSQLTRYLRRKQADRVVDLIHSIRILPGYQRFMLAPECAQLFRAAQDSFVVVLLPYSCQALLVRQGGDSVEKLKLPDMTEEVLEVWTRNIRNTTLRGRGALNLPVGEEVHKKHERGRMRKLQSKTLNEQVQAQLWKRVVLPVLKAFGIQRSSGRQRPRLHWCAAGKFAFMPLHAAGTGPAADENTRVSCSDHVVSSYTSNIATLLQAQESFVSLKLPSTRVLFVGEAEAPGMATLPGVQTELRAIQEALGNHVLSVTSASQGENCAISEVTAGLEDASIAHFACHGIQNPTSPLKSGFCLHDGSLTLAKLMRLEHKQASLAFLSACETAQGDLTQPDESLHLCSAMLFCGFESVIGTMWGISDTDGPIVAGVVYKELAKKAVVDADDIAYALDAGVAELRRQNVPFDRWAPFVHYGA